MRKLKKIDYMRLMILLSISFLCSCVHAPQFPPGEIEFINSQDMVKEVYLTPSSLSGEPTKLREDPLTLQNIDKHVCISFEYYMELEDFRKNEADWAGKHCK